MYIERLTLKFFRNYESAQLEFSPYTNVIYGNNAQGKTNILEAIYLFSQGRSHRAKSDRELIKFGEDFARLAIEFKDNERSYNGQMQLMSRGRKAVSINHVHITKLSFLMNYLNVVMFSPEDLELVKGSPAIRRRFIDSCVSQMYPSYLAALIDYNKALNQKNSLLKMMRINGIKNDATLEIWNEQLAYNGAKIMQNRVEFLKYINSLSKKIQNEISGESLEIRYLPSIKIQSISEKDFFEYLMSKSKRETEAATSMYGVQRDDIEIFVNDKEARFYASQGQQRTAALSLKMAQAEYIHSLKGEYPVMLLDDIMSELDINRRMYLSEKIRDKQVLITSTDTDLIDKTTDTKLFKIDNGTVI